MLTLILLNNIRATWQLIVVLTIVCRLLREFCLTITTSQNFLDIMTAKVWLSLATRIGLGGVGRGVGLSGAVQCALICSESMECRNLPRVAVFPAEAVKPTSASGLFCPWCSSVTSSHSFPLQCVPHLVVQHTSFHWVAPVSPACKIIPGHTSARRQKVSRWWPQTQCVVSNCLPRRALFVRPKFNCC